MNAGLIISELVGCVVGDVILWAFWPTFDELNVPAVLVVVLAIVPWIGLVISAAKE